MKQNTNLPYPNQSIRTRTLIYFMVMALAMITLLWAVQEWFFSARYSAFKQKEIVKIMDEATSEYDHLTSPDYFSRLYKTAVENNMVIYFFNYRKLTSVDKGFEQLPVDGETFLVFNGTFSGRYVLSAAEDEGEIFKDSVAGFTRVGLSAKQEDRLIKMLGLNEGFDTQKSAVWTYDDATQRVYYASEVKRDTLTSKPYYGYFYAEAPISKSDVTLIVIRYEFILLTVVCLVLALIFSYLMSSLLTRPIAKMSRKAKEFAAGDFGIKFDQSSIRELDNLALSLNFAVSEISKTEQLRRDFIANISHDLRTPLTMVKAYAEMIRDISGGNPEKRNLHAQVIIDEANRLSGLVEDIQKLSKIQAGTDTIALTPFDFDELCRAVLRQFDVIQEKFGYSLSYDSDGKNRVVGDRDKLMQVLYNLISNAINYAAKQDKQIYVRQYREGKHAIFEVEDNGKGIAEEDLDAVWDRYYRANQIKRSVVGSGLGLSIVKNILVAHGAEYGIKSQLGKGTIFWFALPLAKEAPATKDNA